MSTFAGTLARNNWAQQTPVATQTPDPTPAPTGLLNNYDATNMFASGLQDGMTQVDNGDGTYNIMQGDQNLGVGYKDVRSAIGDLSFKNADAKTTNTDGTWSNPYLVTARQAWVDDTGKEWTDLDAIAEENRKNQIYTAVNDGSIGTDRITQKELWEPTKLSSKEEVDAGLKARYTTDYYGGEMGDWEALGQTINGGLAPRSNSLASLPSNGMLESITGKNTLYGSTPQFQKGEDGNYELVGYRMDTSPNTQGNTSNGSVDNTKQEGFGTFASHNGKNHSWHNANWRELNDPEAWKKTATFGENGNAFVAKDMVDSIPGWTNKDSFTDVDHKQGAFQKIWEATSIGHNVLGMDFKDAAPIGEAVGNICGAIWSGGIPWGSLIMAADGYSKGEAEAGNKALVRAGLSYAMSSSGSSTGADPAMSAEAYIESGAMGGAPAAGSAYGTSVAANAAAASAAKEAGLSSVSTTMVDAIKDFGAKWQSLSPSDMGIQTGSKFLDNSLLTAGKSALKTAIQKGVYGEDLDNIFKAAVTSALTSLVGNGTSAATGSGLAGTVAGSVTGGLLNQANKPDAPSGGGSSSTPTQTPAPTLVAQTNNTFAGTLARKTWSNS